MWLEMRSYGYWLTSADRFLLEIAAVLMARYRVDELRSADISMLIGLLNKIGFSPTEPQVESTDRERVNHFNQFF
jgi:hypothetical protein